MTITTSLAAYRCGGDSMKGGNHAPFLYRKKRQMDLEHIEIDVFFCAMCETHKSGLELGAVRRFHYANPVRIERTCKDCEAQNK